MTGDLPGVPAIWHSPVGDLVVSTHHPLPDTIAAHPLYSQNLPRLVTVVETKYPRPGLIDIGANIGDTARFVRAVSDTPMLCVEGNWHYLPFLRRNLQGLAGVEIEESFVGDADQKRVWSVTTSNGTALLSAASTVSAHVATKRLDDVLTRRTRFRHAKILKSDTDGFEARVVRGAFRYITDTKPLVFLEYDRRLLEEHGDHGLQMLSGLVRMGYTNVLVYDAFGALLMGVDLSQWSILEQLHAYAGPGTAIPYFDLALFHAQDSDLYLNCLASEQVFFASM
jgi:FkbM family methyltransferase